MNSVTARMLLSKIFEKQGQNPFSDNSVNAANLLAGTNYHPLATLSSQLAAQLEAEQTPAHRDYLDRESKRIRELFEQRDAQAAKAQQDKDIYYYKHHGIPDPEGIFAHGILPPAPHKEKYLKLKKELESTQAADRAKDQTAAMKLLPRFNSGFKGNALDANFATSHPGPPSQQNSNAVAIAGSAAPQTVPPPPRGAGAPPFVTNATNAIADTLKSWGQSVTNNVTPKNISSVIGAPMAALTGSKPSETSGTSSAPTPTLASKNDAGVKAWYENDMVRRAALLGLAGGAGLGGVYALSKMFNKPKPKSKINRNFDFTYPVERIKESGEQGWSNYLFGTNERTPSILDNPLLLSTLALAGGGGLLGGYKGTQLLTDAVLKKTHDDERKKAERDFHDALLSSYASPLSHDPHVKKSSTATMTEVGEALDSLYSTLTQKIANYPGVSTGSAVNDVLAGLPALYLLYAGASGLGTGALAYDYTRKGSKAEALKRALRERDSARYEHAPPELYATAEPIDISRPVSRKEQRSAVV